MPPSKGKKSKLTPEQIEAERIRQAAVDVDNAFHREAEDYCNQVILSQAFERKSLRELSLDIQVEVTDLIHVRDRMLRDIGGARRELNGAEKRCNGEDNGMFILPPLRSYGPSINELSVAFNIRFDRVKDLFVQYLRAGGELMWNMKRYTMSFAESLDHTPEHPERTALKCLSLESDVTFQIWPSQTARDKTIELQGRRSSQPGDWIPCEVILARRALRKGTT